jgi:very-short-patch-repair endonuclease
LAEYGCRVLRFSNEQVLHDLSRVLEHIASAVTATTPTFNSSPNFGGGREGD